MFEIMAAVKCLVNLCIILQINKAAIETDLYFVIDRIENVMFVVIMLYFKLGS